jgi:serine/threonine protein kinase
MSSFWVDSLRSRTDDRSSAEDTPSRRGTKCDNILEFLAIAFSDSTGAQIGLHPVLTSSSPTFSDVSMGGISFDVRKVKASTLPHGLMDEVLKNREFLVVKQPRLNETGYLDAWTLDEIAVELQVLRHAGVRQHSNIIDYLGILYHNVGDSESPRIFPAIVVEYAELGNLRSFQVDGFARDIQDKFDICKDIATGLNYLHRCGIVHGDIKDSNMLVCKDKMRDFVVKISDFGFALSVHDSNPRLVGHTQFLEAPEAHKPLQPEHLVQLDIYSYGLVLYTVMKNGTMYYESIPEESRHENVMKLKTSNLLAATMQSNLLLHMTQDKCLLLIFCGILAYSLRADPVERFHSMEDILDRLKWANPQDLDLELHRNEPLYSVHIFPTGLYFDSEKHLLNAFGSHLDKYCEAVKDQMPLIEMLKDLYTQRMRVEIQMIMTKPKPPYAESYDCCPGLDLTLWRFPIGIAAYSPPAKNHLGLGSKARVCKVLNPF